MAPFTQRYEQGNKMPGDGTARDGQCACCGDRYTVRYYVAGAWFCGKHVPTGDAETNS